mgnify:CR=1 FL=1
MTYSIVALDRESGELGVGIQSRAFRSGAGVPFALPGVGAVASQAFSEKSYGPLGLELIVVLTQELGKAPETLTYPEKGVDWPTEEELRKGS